MIGVTTPSRLLAWALCLAGVALSAFVSFVKGEGEGDWLFPLIFVIGPWLVLAAFCLRWRSSRGLVAAAAFLLAFETGFAISLCGLHWLAQSRQRRNSASTAIE
jgi:uncharacterized membrane protein SirB2